MKRWGYAIVLVALGAAACWKTKPNPAYQHDAGVDGGDAGTGGDMVVRCTDAGSCTGATPICDSTSGVCRACTTTDCSSTTVCDTKSGDPGVGQCVACLQESDCSGGLTCKSDACVKCMANADCASGICDLDAGTCAATTDIVYVDDVGCGGAMDGSSPANAFCQVNDALMALTKKYVLVKGNGDTNPYEAISWTGADLDAYIVGPGKSASQTAFIEQAAKTGVAISPSSGTAAVIMDGLEIVGGGSPARSGVVCSGATATATLAVRDCYIHDSGASGISSTSCTLTVERSLLRNNTGSLSVSGGTFDVENTAFVGGQATTTPPIELSTSTAGVFSFNTVVGYTNTGTAVGGVDCGGGPTQTILASIVYGNTQQGSTQFGPKCALTSTVVGPTDTTAGGLPVTPMFMSDGYHLVVGSNPGIVNQLMSGPAFDIDDVARPIGGKWDIGADEAE